MKTPLLFVAALAMSVSAFSQTSPPAAPTLTAGAEFKGLRLDWDTVPGAAWYQLEYRAHQTGSFVKQASDIAATVTSTHFSFPLHLFDWTYARYRLAACNSAGCSRSAEVSVSNLRRDAVGYFKAAAPVQGGALGDQIDLSPDGYTLAATAPGEITEPTTGGSVGGAIYVFRRGSDGTWRQRARIDAHTSSIYTGGVGLDVAVSASGNTVAVGLTSEVVDATHRGQVDVYFWKNNVYTPTRIQRPDMDEIASVQLSESGYILAVSGLLASTPVTAIYKSTNGVWLNTANVSTGENCWNMTLTRDGKALAGTCREGGDSGPWRDYVRVLSGSNWSTRAEIELDHPTNLDDTHYFHYHSALGLDRTGDTIAVHSGDEYQGGPSTANVNVFHRDGSGYQHTATLKAGEWDTDEDNLAFGGSISISGDGHTMALGDVSDYGTGLGPRAAPLIAGTVPTGAVFVYRLTDSWKLANMVKPNYFNSADPYARKFARNVALSGTGKTLAVGMSGEDSSAKGIDGNWANANLPHSGAIFMY